jgi:hypothetical protein
MDPDPGGPKTSGFRSPTLVFYNEIFERQCLAGVLYQKLTLFRAGVREDDQDLPIQGHMVPAVQGQFFIRL